MDDTDELVKTVRDAAVKYFDLQVGDKIIVTGGMPSVRLTDFMKIEEIK